jgi:hypothetical protein
MIHLASMVASVRCWVHDVRQAMKVERPAVEPAAERRRSTQEASATLSLRVERELEWDCSMHKRERELAHSFMSGARRMKPDTAPDISFCRKSFRLRKHLSSLAFALSTPQMFIYVQNTSFGATVVGVSELLHAIAEFFAFFFLFCIGFAHERDCLFIQPG